MIYQISFSCLYIEGRKALDNSQAHFNKEASSKYQSLSVEKKEELNRERKLTNDQLIGKKSVERRVKKISERIQALVCPAQHACFFYYLIIRIIIRFKL